MSTSTVAGRTDGSRPVALLLTALLGETPAVLALAGGVLCLAEACLARRTPRSPDPVRDATAGAPRG